MPVDRVSYVLAGILLVGGLVVLILDLVAALRHRQDLHLAMRIASLTVVAAGVWCLPCVSYGHRWYYLLLLGLALYPFLGEVAVALYQRIKGGDIGGADAAGLPDAPSAARRLAVRVVGLLDGLDSSEVIDGRQVSNIRIQVSNLLAHANLGYRVGFGEARIQNIERLLGELDEMMGDDPIGVAAVALLQQIVDGIRAGMGALEA